MDKKIGFLAAISIAAMTVTGCSSMRGSSQGAYGSDSYGSGSGSGSSQVSGSGQVAGSGQVSNNDSVSSSGSGRRSRLFGQQYRDTKPATCKPCATAAPKAQNTYTYRPAPKPKTVYRPPAKTTYRAPARPAGQHSQQWYVDRWKRQQQQARNKPRPAANNNTYSGYGSGNYDAGSQGSNTSYYDFSSANATKKANTNVATSNKSIYTGSYQQKTYKPYNPTTYAGGSTATTNTSSTVVSSSGGGASSYTVKKGDTVFEIMRQTGVYWKDIIRINGLQPPYNISPGQIIRLK